MKIKLRQKIHKGDDFDYAPSSNTDLIFLRSAGDGAVFDNVKRAGMNHYELENGVMVHIYHTILIGD